MINRTLVDTLETAILESLSNTHTALIAKVVKVRSKTIDVKPVVNRIVKGKSVELAVFPEVPPVFMQGGTSYTAHPIAVGDYAFLMINERCFDKWYSGQDFVDPPEYRMHDYSDAFAIVGVNPLSTAIQIPSVITQIGDTYQEGNYTHIGNRTQTGNHTQTGNFTLTGDMTINGNLTVSGKITCAEATIGGIDFASHVHPQGADSAGNTEQDTGAAK